MKKIFLLHILFFVFFPSVYSLDAQDKSTPNNKKIITVSTGILPIQNLLSQIVAPYVKVVVLLENNQMPEDMDVSMQKIKLIAGSFLYFSLNLPFEKVLESKKIIASQNFIHLEKTVPFYPFSLTMKVADSEELKDVVQDGDEKSTDIDPHIWMSPINMIVLLKNAVNSIVILDPTHKSYYMKKLNGITNTLLSIHKGILQKLSQVKDKNFLVFHPALGYFAHEYGLTQIAIEKEGKEPSIKELQEIINFIKNKHIKCIFLQTQYPDYVVKNLQDSAHVRIVHINPLAEDYIGQINIIIKALQNKEAN